MIATESFKRFRAKDLLVIIGLALLWFLLSAILDRNLGPQFSYIFSLALATFLMSFTAHFIRKAGSATLFYVFGGLFAFSINDLGVIGINKVLMLGSAGVVFEIVFLIFKIEVKNIQFDIITGTALSAASIPVTMAFMLSTEVAINMIASFINLTLLSFLVGVAGSVLSFMLWHQMRTTKMVLRFEYS